jgi:RNA polymerase sigma factor (TIGR02999 family)
VDPDSPAAPEAGPVTELLLAWGAGDKSALDRLVPLVYRELRQIASRARRNESPGQTLQTTALVHEAYLRLVDQSRAQWQSRSHFFAVAAQAMRRILVDEARRRGADKRGGRKPLQLADGFDVPEMVDEDVLAVDAAVDALEAIDPGLARLVELRFFAGMTVAETATALGVSPATVGREWAAARAWLQRELTDG